MFSFVDGQILDVEAIKKEENLRLDDDSTLVPGIAMQSWVETVKAYESEGSASRNEVVYNIDNQGNKVPIAIVIDGTFGGQSTNTTIPVLNASNDLVHDEWQWIGGEEECASNDVIQDNQQEANLRKSEGEEAKSDV